MKQKKEQDWIKLWDIPIGLYHGQIGSKKWKKYLSDNMMRSWFRFSKSKLII